MIDLPALLIGAVAGLQTVTAPAAASLDIRQIADRC
jgi:uncharacterized membrane protein